MGGGSGDRNVCFIVAEKEVTESCVSVGDALAIKEIKPSGTLGYRFIKRLFDFVFSLFDERTAAYPYRHCVCAHQP